MATKDEICKLAGISRSELDSGVSDITLTGDIVDSLPDGLKLHGLTINYCTSLKSLPDDLDVEYLSLLECPGITTLPENLRLEQLYLFDSNVDKIPANSSCWKELVLINCRNIKKLPDICTAFAGDLYLEGCTGLTSLPDIKVIHGSLNISWTSIRKLPENMIIGGSLDVYCSDIEELPSNIRVGKDYCLDSCKNIKSLPEGLLVNGDLGLSDCSIMNLPGNLVVGGKLDIRSTSINELPDDLIVGKEILSDSCNLDTSKVRKELPFILPELIWKNSGYIYVKDNLYRVIEQHEYWIVVKGILDVYRMKTGLDALYDDLVYYIVKDNSGNYGVGHNLDDAYRDLII